MADIQAIANDLSGLTVMQVAELVHRDEAVEGLVHGLERDHR